MDTPKTLAELETLLAQILPGATVEVDPHTWEVVIRTDRFMRTGNRSDALVGKTEREDDARRIRQAYAAAFSVPAGASSPLGHGYVVEEPPPNETFRQFWKRLKKISLHEPFGRIMLKEYLRKKFSWKKS